MDGGVWWRVWRWIGVVLLAALSGGVAAAQGPLTEVRAFGDNPGNLRMYKYVPDGLPPRAPLVVALHGCSQGATDYDDEAGWTKFADQWRFALLLPEQRLRNNLSRCFTWYAEEHRGRDRGEARSIRSMVAAMVQGGAIDPRRVYVTGLSAGGAMANALLAAYPEVFTAGAIIAGIPHGCADGVVGAVRCMLWGRAQDPAEWGDAVRAASAHQGPWPKVSIWQGDKDPWVDPVNARELLKQWTNVHGIEAATGTRRGNAEHSYLVYADAAGTPQVELHTISGMGHGTPVDPGPGATQCGKAGRFLLDVHICSTYHIGKFWGLERDAGTVQTMPRSSMPTP
ncbi:MAG: PHB depolymerase family esterase [Alphaproteobacteria bacterium]